LAVALMPIAAARVRVLKIVFIVIPRVIQFIN
jgi:hypothetical protein